MNKGAYNKVYIKNYDYKIKNVREDEFKAIFYIISRSRRLLLYLALLRLYLL